MRKLLPALGVAALLTLGLATPAHADTVSFNYTVTDQDPISVSWPDGGFDPITWDHGGRNYVEVTFTVTVTGDYEFEDDFNIKDGRIAFLTGAYDSADVSNCFAEIDDIGTVSLSAGVKYTMMQSGFSGVLGDFQYTVSGPGAFTLEVLATSTTSLTATPNPVTAGAATTLTATVIGATPTGTVEFFAGETSLGTAALTDAVATLSVSTLPVGASSITAVYSGDTANRASSSDPLTVTVTAAAVTSAALPNMGVEIGTVGLGGFFLLLAGAITLRGARRKNA